MGYYLFIGKDTSGEGYLGMYSDAHWCHQHSTPLESDDPALDTAPTAHFTSYKGIEYLDRERSCF